MGRLRLLLTCWLLALSGAALAQGVAARDLDGVLYVSVDDLADNLGYSLSRGSGNLTLRAAAGVVVLFEDSPDILFKPADSAEALERSDQSLAAPVLKVGEVWFAPAELLALLGFTVSDTLTTPEGRSLELDLLTGNLATGTLATGGLATGAGASAHSGRVALGNGVDGLSFYLPGVVGPETVSLLVTDLGLLSLALPAEQRSLDAVMSKFKEEKPLYFVATALGPAPWSPNFTVTQGDRSAELRYPFAVNLLAGDAAALRPDAPASGLILLPQWVNLRQPLSLSWSGVSATIQFRR